MTESTLSFFAGVINGLGLGLTIFGGTATQMVGLGLVLLALSFFMLVAVRR